MSSDSPIPVFTSQQLHELKRQIDVFQEVNASVRAVLSGKEPILSMDTLKRECHVSHVDGHTSSRQDDIEECNTSKGEKKAKLKETEGGKQVCEAGTTSGDQDLQPTKTIEQPAGTQPAKRKAPTSRKTSVSKSKKAKT